MKSFIYKCVQNRTLFHLRNVHYGSVKIRELTPKQILAVPCPTCGAAIEEICELHSGTPRTEPHRDRKLAAADAVEANTSKPLSASEATVLICAS